MPVYQAESGDSDHDHYPSDERAEHVHYDESGQVCIVTLHEDGQEEDEQYDGEPYGCNFCDEEVDYDEEFECDGCGETFETQSGLSTHENHCDELQEDEEDDADEEDDGGYRFGGN